MSASLSIDVEVNELAIAFAHVHDLVFLIVITALLNWQWSQTGGPQTPLEKVMFWTLFVGGGSSGFRYFQVCLRTQVPIAATVLTDRIGELVQAFVLSVGCAGVRSCRPGNDVKFVAVENVRFGKGRFEKV